MGFEDGLKNVGFPKDVLLNKLEMWLHILFNNKFGLVFLSDDKTSTEVLIRLVFLTILSFSQTFCDRTFRQRNFIFKNENVSKFCTSRIFNILNLLQ